MSGKGARGGLGFAVAMCAASIIGSLAASYGMALLGEPQAVWFWSFIR